MKVDGRDARTQQVVDETFDLQSAEWLILWGLRFWAACCRKECSPWPLLGDVFWRNHVEDAALSLDALLRLTSLTSLRPLDVRCPACPRISPDERRLLAAVSGSQRGRKASSSQILRTWLPPAASRMGLNMIEGLAKILADAGHRLPERRDVVAADHSLAGTPNRLEIPIVH